MRQHLRLTSGDRTVGMELALQKRGGELVLVGLHPLGAKLFSVRQVGTDLEVEALPAQVLDIPPENVLRDIHRVYFLSLAPPVHDGTIRGVRGETEIRERWETGTLRERSFGADADSPDSARVVFAPVPAAGAPLATVHHTGCGYRAEIRTLSRQSLP
jgi:hypothetical protein